MIRSPTSLHPGRFVFYLTSWVFCLVIVGGGPTVLYVMTYSLPSDSVIEKDVVPFFGDDLESILNQGLALYLAFFSSILLPNLTEITVRKMIVEMRSGKQHALQTIMAIVARTLLVIVVPCVAVVVFNDGCYRGWMQLWTPCTLHALCWQLWTVLRLLLVPYMPLAPCLAFKP